MKEQKNSLEKLLNEVEASNLPDMEFKRRVIIMLKKLSENYKVLSENYNNMKKDIDIIKNNQSEMEIQYMN